MKSLIFIGTYRGHGIFDFKGYYKGNKINAIEIAESFGFESGRSYMLHLKNPTVNDMTTNAELVKAKLLEA